MGSIARLFSANIAMLAVQLKVVRCGEPQEHQTREPPLLHQVLNLRKKVLPPPPFSLLSSLRVPHPMAFANINFRHINKFGCTPLLRNRVDWRAQ